MTTDTRILIALRGAGTGFVSGAELSQQLGNTRAAIWARIVELRKLGYDIAAKGPADLSKRIAHELTQWRDVTKQAGLVVK